MRVIYHSIIFTLLISITFASNQNTEYINVEGDEYLAFAEEMASPVGGLKAILEQVEYPSMAMKSGVQGKVYLMAFISTDGEVDDVKVIRGIGAGCDEAAVEAVKKTKFNPGKANGVPVKVKYSFPVTFKITN